MSKQYASFLHTLVVVGAATQGGNLSMPQNMAIDDLDTSTNLSVKQMADRFDCIANSPKTNTSYTPRAGNNSSSNSTPKKGPEKGPDRVPLIVREPLKLPSKNIRDEIRSTTCRRKEA